MPSPASPPFPDMVLVPGGAFTMGSDRHYPEEGPAHRVSVDGFWIDRSPVTNRQFARFVAETGHVTLAETAPDPAEYPGVAAEMLRPASLLFTPPDHPVVLSDWSQWWALSFDTNWRHPHGPQSSLRGLEDHPVVHVGPVDAEVYAAWAGGRLPSEAEWEFAARGGLDGADYAWGDVFMPDGQPMAKIWQGAFPNENLAADGFARTAPVASYPANGYGLFDMTGNVWEWTGDFYGPHHAAAKPCCVPHNPRNRAADQSHDPDQTIGMPRRVIKGGSHLCAPSYCQRYRPAARSGQAIDSPTSHIGFRCVRDPV